MAPSPLLIPELAVIDCGQSLQFYCDILGFEILYQRPEQGFARLVLFGAELMIDQINIGRTFGIDEEPLAYPFGRGLNLQITVPAVAPMLDALEAAGIAIYLPLEEKWYRSGDDEIGQRQFVVPDPDGYLLRFSESLGTRTPIRHV